MRPKDVPSFSRTLLDFRETRAEECLVLEVDVDKNRSWTKLSSLDDGRLECSIDRFSHRGRNKMDSFDFSEPFIDGFTDFHVSYLR